MYRFALLSCVLLLVQGEPNANPKCDRFLHSEGLSCCTKDYNFSSHSEQIKECMQLPAKPPSCEREICIAKKKGFGSDDGTIDKTALVNLIKKEAVDDTELVQSLIENCIEGDISQFGPPDFCDLMKMRNCWQLHFVADCPDWKNDGKCTGAKEAAEECVKELV